MIVTHFCQFADEATALAALSGYVINGAWRSDIVVAGIAVTEPTGQTITDPKNGAQYPGVQLKPGFFLNVALPTLYAAMPGLTGAGQRDANGNWITLFGTAPAAAPQCEFSWR